jgi:DNA-binding MarR family transcriptional regulator
MDEQRDAVDRIEEDWQVERPDLDMSPVAVIGRVSRFSRLIDKRLGENFARFEIEDWMFDVLATLRRIGYPYELTAGELVRQSMVTTGAITNRVDRLVERDLVRRTQDPDDRRKVIVQLTQSGLDLVEAVLDSHLETEQEMLAALSTPQQEELKDSLRTLLLAMGDFAE